MSKINLKKLFGFCVYLVVASALLLEVALRLKLFEPTYNMLGFKIVLDEKMGYRVKPFSNPEINNLGFRGPDVQFNKGNKKRILVLGDSMVYGWDVKPEQSFAAQLEKKLGEGYQVLNMGVVGYGPDQSLGQLKKLGLRLKPDAVILGIFADNDFQDIERNGLLSINKAGKLTSVENNPVRQAAAPLRIIDLMRWLQLSTKSPSQPLAIQNSPMSSLFYRYLGDRFDKKLMGAPNSPASIHKKDLMRAILKEYKSILEKGGVQFLVVILPSYEILYAPEEVAPNWKKSTTYLTNIKAAQTICETESIPFIQVYDAFKKQVGHSKLLGNPPTDRHLNYAGHTLIAELCLPILRQMSGRH